MLAAAARCVARVVAPPRSRARRVAAAGGLARAPVARASSSSSSASSSSSSSASSASAAGGTTHFGFEEVPAADKSRRVAEVFSRVADTYDVMNDAMSGGLHRAWKDEFVRAAGPLVARGGARAPVLLDVAGGTGDVAFRLAAALRRSPVRHAGGARPAVIVADINADMLRVGEARAAAAAFARAGADGGAGDEDAGEPELRWVVGDAEALPLPDASVDLYTIAFGIRNVTRVDAALRDALRVLRPGGRFMCLEFARVSHPAAAAAYDAYSFHAIPALGAAIAGDRASYEYLVESIRRFPPQAEFAAMIRAAGFVGVEWTDLSLGVCAIHSGFKPALLPRRA